MKQTIFSIFILTACSVSGQSALELAGHWYGTGAITASWCEQNALSFHISITTEDEVMGTVGDAEIVNGVCEKDKTGNGKQYIITLKLKGDLIECESIKRNTMVLHVTREGDMLKGTFYTEGYIFGKKQDGIMTGDTLELVYK